MKGQDPDTTAVRLAVAIKQLRTRVREAARGPAAGLSVSQLAIVKRLRDGGPATAASLAQAEHVSQQAIAQQVASLKRAGMVLTAPDPDDRRKTLIRLSAKAHKAFEAVLAARDAWLAQAIDATVSPRERRALDKAVELLERLAAYPGSR